MKKNIRIALIVLVVLALVFLALRFVGGAFLSSIVGSQTGAPSAEAPYDGSLIGKRAPAFDLPRYGGGRMKLSDVIGSPTIVIFWATWNKESEDQLKILDDYMANERDQAALVRIVAVDSQEDPSIVASYMKRGGYSVPTLIDSFGDVSTLYGVKGLPEAYFIAKDGTVSDAHRGILSEQGLMQRVESLIKQSGI